MSSNLVNFFLLLTIIFCQSNTVTSSRCDCLTEENLKKSGNHLKLVTKITSLKILPTVRDMIYQADREKYYLLERTRYDMINHLRSRYGMLITHTDFQQHFQRLIQKIEDNMRSTKMTSIDRKKHLTEYLIDFYADVLPSAFLCLTMGECISASSSYTHCMRKNSRRWHAHFGREHNRIARSIAQTIETFQLIENRLMELQTILIDSDNRLSDSCYENYTKITNCVSCVADRMGYCRSACQKVSLECFSHLDTQFDLHIFALSRLKTFIEDEFSEIRRGISTDLRRLVEVSSPALARDVVVSCGNLIIGTEGGRLPATKAAPIYNQIPKPIPRRLVQMISQLLEYRDHWKRIAERVCSQPSAEHFCWNGTNIVRSVEAVDQFEEPSIIKNVRPHPKIPDIEASGNSWTDDEDLIEGSGSGDEPVEVYDSKNNIPMTPRVQQVSSTPSSSVNSDNDEDASASPGVVAPSSGSLSNFLCGLAVLVLVRQF